jgi:hypothetical protein
MKRKEPIAEATVQSHGAKKVKNITHEVLSSDFAEADFTDQYSLTAEL